MRGYKLTFFLAAALLVAAVIAKMNVKGNIGDLFHGTGSGFLLAGGIILTGYGYYEYYQKKEKK